MKDSFAVNKKVRISVYTLPKTIYVKFSVLAWFLIVLGNGLSIFFITLLWNERDMILKDLISFFMLLIPIILVIYVDIDVMHAIMKKQFIEVSDVFIRVKKLTSDKKFNWSEIKSIEEMYSIRFRILSGVKLEKLDKDKTYLLKSNIVINFNKFANVDIEEFFEVLYRKKSSHFRTRY